MLKFVRVLICAMVLGTSVPASIAQEQADPQQKSEATFFSGNVVSVSTDKVTVARRTLGLTTITRVFLRNENTQIEGKLQPKARVTVKFEKTDDGDLAVRIIVR